MTLFLIIIVLLWYGCGILCVAGLQAWSSNVEEAFKYNRAATLWLCYGLGPFLVILFPLWSVVKLPIRYGTWAGRALGRKINPDNE